MNARDRIQGVGGIAQQTLELFLRKSADYDNNAEVLGTAGQFADIWRKIHKLKKALWDGESLVGEQPEEILMDLIGHCWLTIDMLREEKRKESPHPDSILSVRQEVCPGPTMGKPPHCGDPACYKVHL